MLAAVAAATALVPPLDGAPEEPARPEPSLSPAAPGGETPVMEGEKFPALDVIVFLRGQEEPVAMNLSRELGKRPVIFSFFNLGHEISEGIMDDVRRFVAREVPGKVAHFPVVRLGDRISMEYLVKRLELLGIPGPLILDENEELLRALDAKVVPHIALIDGNGYLCFRGAMSLKQPIMEQVDVAESIRMAARGEQPPTVHRLLRYYPVNDTVGGSYFDLTLPSYRTGKEVKLSDQIGPGRMTALLYFSPGDRHSRQVVPAFVAAHKTYASKGLSILAIARDGSPGEIEAFAKEFGATFPILENKGKRFSSLYRVLSTPTLLIIGPDGVVDSVYTSGKINYFPVLMTKLSRLVKRPGTGS